ncbi:MAG: DUF2304 domain-containing protein [Eubacteriales bacterium]|nr:DUF2304 domain-containing protein [Eubacteriales bacterium]
MGSGVILQMIMVLVGLIILCVTMASLAKNSMTVSFCLSWGMFAVILMIAGIFLRPTIINRFISKTGLVLLIMFALGSIFGIYFMSCKISELVRKNNEIAIQMSLMNAEKEELEKRIQQLEEKIG